MKIQSCEASVSALLASHWLRENAKNIETWRGHCCIWDFLAGISTLHVPISTLIRPRRILIFPVADESINQYSTNVTYIMCAFKVQHFIHFHTCVLLFCTYNAMHFLYLTHSISHENTSFTQVKKTICDSDSRIELTMLLIKKQYPGQGHGTKLTNLMGREQFIQGRGSLGRWIDCFSQVTDLERFG
ncbi:75d40bb3-ccf3-4bc4-92f2-1059aec30698 [Sclerotinia trifoliorum]|uniref:75d40bb3-ccf3-4bc4-92f2-1059aec30698 n=1 Tax=Sclerotinia trifoliorum TaxID=28548 RepID=A0A8H2VNG6_9HELO|nr:75d40bb3-ccf3-4bc4-92f2-1059aec30698 [Sclerotinia trifoliorum]